MAEQAIYYDTSLCTGCKGCQVACKCWNNLPSPTELNVDEKTFTGTYQNPPDLNDMTRIIMTFNEETGGPKGIKWAFGRRSCQHCGDAPCAQICPSGAIYIDEETHLVTTDDTKCIGCQYCSIACPFDVPRYFDAGPDAIFKRTTINKCTGCVDRVRQGLDPACVTTCQPGALKFGDRDEMIQLAHERVDWLKERGFEDAVVYGENEVGGLHVIQVLKYGVKAHEQVENPTVTPLTTAIEWMRPITGVVSGLTVLGLGAMAALATGYRRDELAYNVATTDTVDMTTEPVVKHGDPQDPESVMDHIKAVPLFKDKKGGSDE